MCRSAAAIVAAALISIATMPHQVIHTRCAKLIAQDDYDRFEWVTRDGRRDDVFGESCHPVRFKRSAMIEWPAEDLPATSSEEP